MRRHRCTDRRCSHCYPGPEGQGWAWPYALALLALIATLVFWATCVHASDGATWWS